MLIEFQMIYLLGMYSESGEHSLSNLGGRDKEGQVKSSHLYLGKVALSALGWYQ